MSLCLPLARRPGTAPAPEPIDRSTAPVPREAAPFLNLVHAPSRRQPCFALQLRGHLGLEALQVADDPARLVGLAAVRHAPAPAGTSRTGSSAAVRCCASSAATASSSRPWRISARPEAVPGAVELGVEREGAAEGGFGGRRAGRRLAQEGEVEPVGGAARRDAAATSRSASASGERGRARLRHAGGRGWRARRHRSASGAAWRRTPRSAARRRPTTSSAIARSFSRR